MPREWMTDRDQHPTRAERARESATRDDAVARVDAAGGVDDGDAVVTVDRGDGVGRGAGRPRWADGDATGEDAVAVRREHAVPRGAAAEAAASIPRIGASAVADDLVSHNLQGVGFRLVTEKNLDLKIFFGEQDSRNRISYIKWSRHEGAHRDKRRRRRQRYTLHRAHISTCGVGWMGRSSGGWRFGRG